jgi:hypothetical protein
MKSSGPLAVIGLRRTDKSIGKAGIRPTDLHRQIMGQQPVLHGHLSMLDLALFVRMMSRINMISRA